MKGGTLELSNDKKVIFIPKSKASEVCFSYSKSGIEKVSSKDFDSIKVSVSKKRWPQVIKTSAKLGENKNSYTVDNIVLPLKNSWKRSLRIASLDFFKDGL